MTFQSTPPVKAATRQVKRIVARCTISIHAAREGGDDTGVTKEGAFGISIHAAREGGDVVGLINGRLSSISIHAAREGGDYK